MSVFSQSVGTADAAAIDTYDPTQDPLSDQYINPLGPVAPAATGSLANDGTNLNSLSVFFSSVGHTIGDVFKSTSAPQPVSLQGRPLIPFSSSRTSSSQSGGFVLILVVAIVAFFAFRIFGRSTR